MVKLDSIFKSLGIETENDVRLLAQYFINHRQYKELLKSKKSAEDFKSGDSESSSQVLDAAETSGPVINDQIELIHPNEVLTAIKTFLSFHRKQEGYKINAFL